MVSDIFIGAYQYTGAMRSVAYRSLSSHGSVA